MRRRSASVGFDRGPQQLLPLVLVAPQAPGERRGERHLEQLEQQQRPEAERSEAQPQAPPGLGDAGVAEVRLEQQWRAVGRRHRHIHLEQLRRRLLVAVLRLGEVADAGMGLATVEHR